MGNYLIRRVMYFCYIFGIGKLGKVTSFVKNRNGGAKL